VSCGRRDEGRGIQASLSCPAMRFGIADGSSSPLQNHLPLKSCNYIPHGQGYITATTLAMQLRILAAGGYCFCLLITQSSGLLKLQTLAIICAQMKANCKNQQKNYGAAAYSEPIERTKVNENNRNATMHKLCGIHSALL